MLSATCVPSYTYVMHDFGFWRSELREVGFAYIVLSQPADVTKSRYVLQFDEENTRKSLNLCYAFAQHPCLVRLSSSCLLLNVEKGVAWLPLYSAFLHLEPFPPPAANAKRALSRMNLVLKNRHISWRGVAPLIWGQISTKIVIVISVIYFFQRISYIGVVFRICCKRGDFKMS